MFHLTASFDRDVAGAALPPSSSFFARLLVWLLALTLCPPAFAGSIGVVA